MAATLTLMRENEWRSQAPSLLPGYIVHKTHEISSSLLKILKQSTHPQLWVKAAVNGSISSLTKTIPS